MNQLLVMVHDTESQINRRNQPNKQSERMIENFKGSKLNLHDVTFYRCSTVTISIRRPT
jgi:hypothetical protein